MNTRRKVIGFGANLSTTCSNALVGFETRICAALIGSARSGGTKTPMPGLAQQRDRIFGFAKKLISPSVASPRMPRR